ncbi:MAG: hypothetical protein KBC11_02605 [Candidatus Pacebacteria bacterium]|nr:hypothetical protein [Candidatus Paceibacterota bacterium]
MINLLPYREKKSIEKIRMIRFLQSVTIGFLLICVAIIFLLLPTFFNINYRFSLETKQIDELQKKGMVSSDVDLSNLAQRSKSVESKLSIPKIVEPTEYIKTITDFVLPGLSIDRFATIEAKTLEISGVVDTRETLQAFIKIIEGSPTVSSVDSPVSNFVKSKNSEFKITVLFK